MKTYLLGKMSRDLGKASIISLMFIDDYTHMLIVYLLKNKSEVFTSKSIYYNYAIKYFGSDLLKFRLHIGDEYVSC